MVGTSWFDIWFDDKVSVLETMMENLLADLAAGYDPDGSCVCKQLTDIEEYTKTFNVQMDDFKYMETGRVNHWCYYDLKKRGVIL